MACRYGTKADSPIPKEDYFNMYNRWNLPLKTWVPNQWVPKIFHILYLYA